jgi:hypothetical protein
MQRDTKTLTKCSALSPAPQNILRHNTPLYCWLRAAHALRIASGLTCNTESANWHRLQEQLVTTERT